MKYVKEEQEMKRRNPQFEVDIKCEYELVSRQVFTFWS